MSTRGGKRGAKPNEKHKLDLISITHCEFPKIS